MANSGEIDVNVTLDAKGLAKELKRLEDLAVDYNNKLLFVNKY